MVENRIFRNLQNEQREIEHLASEVSDSHLQDFYAEANKENGSDYEASSLANIQALLDQYLTEVYINKICTYYIIECHF